MSLVDLAIPLVIYTALVLTVGAIASRSSKRTAEDYFLAGRGLGTFVLFMALFGTNATAFVLVGIPGKAYHDGIGTFSVNAPIIALGIPMTFWAIGSPARRMAKAVGALTPAELFSKRFGSRAVGYVLFLSFTLYTLPYMVTAVKGAALTLAVTSEQAIPQWAGALGVVVVAVIYTSIGGMLGTAWTNVLQGILFLTFMILAFFFMADSLGGLDEVMARVARERPDLLELPRRGLFAPRAFASWGIAIAFTVIAFPHMLVRLMAGKSERALKGVTTMYPIALVLLWTPAVLIGIFGAIAVPGLEDRASDKILSLMSREHLPAFFAPFGFIAVLAAVMSTIDAQLLTLSSMLTRDVIDPLRSGETGDSDDVRLGRGFVVGIALVVYVLALKWGSSVFEIAAIAFSGYVTLVPCLFFGVRWKRFTAPAAIASILAANLVLGLGLGGVLPMFGFLPVFWALVTGLIVAVGVSFATEPPDPDLTARAFG